MKNFWRNRLILGFCFVFMLLLIPQANLKALGVCPGEEAPSRIEETESFTGRVRRGEEKWYFFTAEESQLWRIEMTGEDDEYYSLGILDPDTISNKDAATDDFFFEYLVGNTEYISAFRTRSEGIYCLRIGNDSDARSLDYEFRLELFTIRNEQVRDIADLDYFGTNTVALWYYDRTDYDTALELFIHASELKSDDAVLNGNVCNTAFLLGQYDVSVDYCTEVIALGKNLISAYRYRANSYRALGAYDRADHDYAELIELDSKNVDWYFARGLNDLLRADGDAAYHTFEEYNDIGSFESPYWRALGLLLTHDFEEAADDFEYAIEVFEDLDANPFYPVWALAVALDLSGGSEREIDDLLEAAEGHAEDFEDSLQRNRALALVALTRGDYAETQRLYYEVLHESPLADDRTIDLVYFTVLEEAYSGHLAYDALLAWFKSELSSRSR